MRQGSATKFRPGLERFEEKQLLSATPVTAQIVIHEAAPGAVTVHSASTSTALGAVSDNAESHAVLLVPADRGRPASSGPGFLAFRVTQRPYKLVPPFQHVLVQFRKPVPGKVYNVLYVAVKNGTAQTFDATSGFAARLPGGHALPILTGTEQWKPGQVIVFYVLTKKYYPLAQVPGGFQFDLGGRSSTLIPGPSGIFLRLNYNPARFARTLDWIVAFGQGAQGGLGPKFGLPDTAINEFVSARTRRIDYGGHF